MDSFRLPRLRDFILGVTCIGGVVLDVPVDGAMADQASPTTPAGPQFQIEEIVVTAEKRGSTVLDTPLSLTVVTGEQLQAQGLSTMDEAALRIPGISMRSEGPGQTEFEMRGLASSAGSSPTVGFYLDETPLTPPAAAGNGKVVVDPDLFDLNRIEVLRGPQGTLYGSGSMGGTIRLLTNQPDLGHYTGSAEFILSGAQSGGISPGGNAMLNIPLVDGKVALRIVGTDKFTDGWIDRIVVNPFPFPTNSGCAPTTFFGCARGDVVNGRIAADYKDVNWEHTQGGRASLRVTPFDDLDVVTTAMYQRITMGGYNNFDAPPGGNGRLAHYQPFNSSEPFADTFKVYSTVINYDLGFARLTSATSYWSREEKQTQDVSEGTQSILGLNSFYPGLSFPELDYSHQFSEEMRLTSSNEGPFRWLAGAFWSSFESIFDESWESQQLCFVSAGGCSANPLGALYVAYNPYHIDQYALFGEGTYNLTDAIKVTMGLRWYKYISSVSLSQRGVFTASGNSMPTLLNPNTQANGYNPKFTLSYEPDQRLDVYVTASKGFRPGGVNLPIPLSGPGSCLPSLQATGLTQAPLVYGPDSIWNYELGEKARLFDGRLTVNGDFYYIKWNGVQQAIPLACGYGYTNNAGNAATFGPELEITAELTPEITLSINGAYTDATITKTYATTGLVSGVPVLNIPRYTESASLTYHKPIADGLVLAVRASNTYVGPATDIAFGRTNLQPYNLVDLRLGLIGKAWSSYLFVTNLTDKHAELTTNYGSTTFFIPSLTRVTTNQPRTFGLDLQYSF